MDGTPDSKHQRLAVSEARGYRLLPHPAIDGARTVKRLSLQYETAPHANTSRTESTTPTTLSLSVYGGRTTEAVAKKLLTPHSPRRAR